MKKLAFLLTGLMITLTACAQDNWKKVVGLPSDCNNPVFTRPGNMHSSSRIQGAGINMNDGEAYTDTYIQFNNDWHYAPKLPLCQQEMDVMPQVMGLYIDQNHPLEMYKPLKFSVRTHHGCGAVVVYRAFRNCRYSNIESDNLEQFIAVYDGNGRLTDCMMMGYDGDMCDVLRVEPHKDYQVPNNMGDHHLVFDEKGGEHFTISRYWYLKDEAKGLPDKVEMCRYYSITPEGKIRLDKVTNGSENHKQGSTLKAGAPISEVANPAAVDMMELIVTPMSDPQLLTKLDKTYASLKDDKQVGERLMHLGMLIYNRSPKSFLSYAYENRTKTSLLTLLKRAKAYEGKGLQYENCIDETLDKCSPTPKSRTWLKSRIK